MSSPTTGVLGISEIEGVEGVDLAEGDDIADVADEANGLDSLAVAHVADAADLDQFAVGLAQNPDERLELPSQVSPLVVTTRRWPSCSLSENWLRRSPGTEPEAV